MTKNNETPTNDLDNDLENGVVEFGIEWVAAHLLAIIIFLENKFGDDAGHTIGAVAADLLEQFKEEDSDSE